LAMRRACAGLAIKPVHAQIDGNLVPKGLVCSAQAIVQGDALVPAISAASILAKTARDADCSVLHEQYPQYEFDRHKGYGTVVHLERLRRQRQCPAYRLSCNYLTPRQSLALFLCYDLSVRTSASLDAQPHVRGSVGCGGFHPDGPRGSQA